LLQVQDSIANLEIPPSSECRSVSFILLCVCVVEEVTHKLGKHEWKPALFRASLVYFFLPFVISISVVATDHEDFSQRLVTFNF